jgi:hypothetical protein
MSAALHAFGGQWACSGLRAVADDATPVRFGSSPEVDALLRAQDALYLHRRASLGFLSYNPIAAGRSLMVESELWQRSAGLPAGVADPFLEWGRHRAWSDEPVYLDEPGCLIPAGSAGLHLHGQLPRMVAWTESRLAGEARDDAADSGLRRGYALFRAHHWRQMCTPQWWPLPDETLLACAATLGIVPGESSPSIPVGSQA